MGVLKLATGRYWSASPAARWGDPKDAAGAAVFLASSASDFVHGHVLVVDGGWMGR
jgi:2-dehydro-3-deoxy-D-gluconate 5-dehydrogenase